MDIKILYPATYRLPYFSTLHNHSGYFFQSLSWAISKNHQGVVKLLVERGADTKKLHSDGQTAMDLAIAQDLQLVKEFCFFPRMWFSAAANSPFIPWSSDSSRIFEIRMFITIWNFIHILSQIKIHRRYAGCFMTVFLGYVHVWFLKSFCKF